MKEWIVRGGTERSGGSYLWSLTYVPPPVNYGINTIRGGYYDRREETGAYLAEWDDSQLGAERFDRIDKAARAAKRCGGRVVALKRSTPR